MCRILSSTVSDRCAGGSRLVVAWLLATLAAAGCRGEPKSQPKSVAEPPTVQVSSPSVRTIVRVVSQPSFIESYERTAIYPKMTAYIEKWIVDIGDKVKKGEVFATLFVPEMREDWGTKKATVQLDKELIDLALKLVQVAEADVESAVAGLAEAKAILAKYQAEVDRWDMEVKRLTREVSRGVVDPQILLESTNQWKSSVAARSAAGATIRKAEAELLSKQATLAKEKVNVSVARASLAVAESDERRLAAWVGYLTLTAPFDGVIVARNANTGDFVLPAAGDPTALQRTPDISPSGAAPIYVVDRLDIVRVFVDIPERDANFVHIGTKASVLAQAFRDEELPATVTRTAWALNIKSRTLRAEIDLTNPESKLLPGMYAYGKLIIERTGVRAVPLDALVHRGDQTFCWLYRNGKAVRTELETGVSDDEWIEVTSHRPPVPREAPSNKVPWTRIDGSEPVILGDLSILADGETVRVAPATGVAKIAGVSP
jgi:HlyD family secretion protein